MLKRPPLVRLLAALLVGPLAVPSLPVRADDTIPIQRVEVNAVRDSEWASYRQAYKAAARAATYTRGRPLIQAQLQIRPLSPEASLEGLKLHLAGAKTSIDIDVDPLGLADIPMSKQAYDEDAVLRLNRQKGRYYFSGRYSIRAHADGVYQIADLRAACEQLIDAQRDTGYRLRLFGKRCAGIKFSYAAGGGAAAVEIRREDGSVVLVAMSDAHPFEDNTMGIYKVAIVRFADLPQQGSVVTVVTVDKPLAIGTLYE